MEVDEAPAQLHPSPREPRAVVPYSTRSYPNARGRTLSRQVVPWRGSKVRPRGAAYDRARGGTTARVGVRPHGAGGPTMTKQCALPGTPGSTGQRCAAVSAHGTGLHNSGLQRHRPAQDRIGGSFNARLHRPTARAGGAGLRGLQDASRTHVGAGTCTRSSTRRAPKTSGAQCAGGACPNLLQRSRLPVSAERSPEYQQSVLRVPAGSRPCNRLGHPNAGTNPTGE